MPRKSTPKIPRRKAERQEVLFAKFQALTRQVQVAAGRRPGQAVPDDVRALAEALLFEVQPFRELRRRAALPVAAPHYGGLSAQLAEALTALMAFETRHTQWDAVRMAPVWSVPHEIMKVKRLAPKPGSRAAARAAALAEVERQRHEAEMLDLRDKLVERLVQFRMREPQSRSADLSPVPTQPLWSLHQPDGDGVATINRPATVGRARHR